MHSFKVSSSEGLARQPASQSTRQGGEPSLKPSNTPPAYPRQDRSIHQNGSDQQPPSPITHRQQTQARACGARTVEEPGKRRFDRGRQGSRDDSEQSETRNDQPDREQGMIALARRQIRGFNGREAKGDTRRQGDQGQPPRPKRNGRPKFFGHWHQPQTRAAIVT